ncbi:single-stranded DNA-binding [Chlorella sorokiniana]|uniref:Single-stranded DNA-binding n=1 Tax=Chlorella sorokiniana TaxID=3076 RepID=A0A2P6TBY7_CHLSO|nr:single-stranded DNA-binding [Chlorella sorokiniana]|eukprot:PRW18399.1 single-stranded DNA-binding [Chlorella sorokiniana]
MPSRARRLCGSATVSAAAAADAAPWDAPAVEPPPTVPFSPDAVNSVAVSGTVLKDPQVYHLAAQQVKAQLRLGLSHLHAPAGAINVDAWGVLALQVAQHVRAGSRIQVRGSLRQDSWLDKHTGERQWMVKIVADELGLLAHHDGEGGHHAEAAAAADAAAHAALQHEQPMPPQAEVQRPRATASAEQSRHMYEGEGLPLDAIAARRGIKASTVIDHLLATAAAGTFSPASWARLAAEVGLGQEGGPLLAPSEVAQAIADVEQQYAGTELGMLPLRAMRERLETDPATGPKVAALLAPRGGDPVLAYGSIKLVLAALQQGVSFGLLSSRGGQPPF